MRMDVYTEFISYETYPKKVSLDYIDKLGELSDQDEFVDYQELLEKVRKIALDNNIVILLEFDVEFRLDDCMGTHPCVFVVNNDGKLSYEMIYSNGYGGFGMDDILLHEIYDAIVKGDIGTSIEEIEEEFPGVDDTHINVIRRNQENQIVCEERVYDFYELLEHSGKSVLGDMKLTLDTHGEDIFILDLITFKADEVDKNYAKDLPDTNRLENFYK